VATNLIVYDYLVFSIGGTILKRLILCAILLCLAPALADPCGMVPPISLDGQNADISRVGEQKTYVFYKDGIETVVIHPAFEGNVDEFGMLIPFPNPPSLRKVPDNTFEQLAKAIEPPTIDFWVRRPMPMSVTRAPGGSEKMSLERSQVASDQVVVLKEEAVGMYEVAVLEAGSAAALKRWMTEHRFRFPDGMESTCEDYVKDKWCFVAVKTRIGQKSGVDPRPGMRATHPEKPADATFKGQVQAMGFRFPSKRLEVPMRLSAFNSGDLHNIVILLADQPMRASNLPKDLVTRQLSGDELYRNLTQPLPYKIHGGTEDDMSPNDWERLNAQRDPVPHNGVAAELFASDLFVIERGELSHGSEEREKSLLDIGERLGLRGGSLDALHHKALAKDRELMKKESLGHLKSMHLTVLDGDFPREVVSRENIRFEPFKLKAEIEPPANALSAAARYLLTLFS
jgi:Uncharacterized protein conserved in bacteria (DUF2330)